MGRRSEFLGCQGKARVLLQGIVVMATLAITSTAFAQPSWPQEISAGDYTIVVYQPQPETLNDNLLSGRAAISIEGADLEEPIFGAMWYMARLYNNDDSDTVTVREFTVTQVTWPDSNDVGEQKFINAVQAAVPEAGFTISRERLSASLENAEVVRESLNELKNDPPVIVFRKELSVLLIYDGEPKFREVENSSYKAALNTPFAVACHTSNGSCYLSSGKFWYESSDPLGPFNLTNSPPQDLVSIIPESDEEIEGPDSPPSIVVATEPTELISSQGAAEWTALAGGDILYVSNTETPWLRELSTGNMYVLLSGRWFRSNSEDGPWTFVRADKLPESFSQIPPASDIGGLRTSVAGTPEAHDAVLDSAIPQTAAIDRSTATLTVEYEGVPKFEAVTGTKVSYAVNTASQVLEIEGSYFAVDNGVWFTSSSATGPWEVADEIPDEEIDRIPPSSPVYNTTYVKVYESTPEIVYVGYTPGYTWSYPYYGVPVYGTGWYYPPYWGGGYYYPRVPTWGLHVGYNPWTGWNFGLSWSNGFFRVGIGWSSGWGGYPRYGCCGGWYGGGYRGPTFINTGDINIGNNINIGNRTEIGNKIGDRGGLNRDRVANRDVYNRPENRARKADPATASRELQKARPANNRANNVFADRNGNVARTNGNTWESRQNGQWASQRDRSATTQTRPATQQTRPSTRPSTQQRNRSSLDYGSLNRSNHARQRGSMRETSHRNMNRGHSMQRRGGGRRR